MDLLWPGGPANQYQGRREDHHDVDELLAFFDYPCEHWVNLRRRMRAWLAGVHAGPDRAQNIPSGEVSYRLLVGPLMATRAVNGRSRQTQRLTSPAPLLMPLANAAAGIRRSPRSALRAASFGEMVISHTTPRDRGRQAGERAAAGMTSVRGPAAAWRSGMSYMADGCIWCRRG